MLSSVSAACVDLFLSTRFLYFLANCGYAPVVCERLFVWGKKRDRKFPLVGFVTSVLLSLLGFTSASKTGSSIRIVSHFHVATTDIYHPIVDTIDNESSSHNVSSCRADRLGSAVVHLHKVGI